MTSTVEGFPVLSPGSPLLHTWLLPGVPRRLTLRNGSAGLILAFVAHWFNEHVERLDQPGEGAPDDGGYSHRQITGGSSWSKHATGTAEDLNWRRHPYGVPARNTFTVAQRDAIRGLCRRRVLGGVVEWGGDWPSHPGSSAQPDAMHFQIDSGKRLVDCERVAIDLIERRNPRALALLDANPGQRQVIFS